MKFGDKFRGPKKVNSVAKDLKTLIRNAEGFIASVINIPEPTGRARKDLDDDDTPDQSLIDNIAGYANAIRQPAIARNLGEVKRLLQEVRGAITIKDKSSLPDPFEAEPDEAATPLHALLSTLKEQFTNCGHDLKNGKNITDKAIAELMQKCQQIDDLSQEIAQGLKEKGLGKGRRQ